MNKYLQTVANSNSLREKYGDKFYGSLSTSEPYQREPIDILHKVNIVNDSRSTTLNAAWFSLSECNKPIIWIVGNMFVDVDNLKQDYMLEQYRKIKALVVLEDGTCKPSVWDKVADKVPVIVHATPSSLINTIRTLIQKGDTILFSPAAPSSDLFDNYMSRGQWFSEQFITSQ